MNLSTQSGVEQAIRILDKAIDQIPADVLNGAAYQNLLEHTYNNVTNTSENLNSTFSRIKDADWLWK
ncbi:flagellin [Bacillus sp. J14TS2]|uniref:flagellin n=1 Tax=Bacillus sp. J14TS2 TaxID=2807188 RepID=UPI001BB43715